MHLQHVNSTNEWVFFTNFSTIFFFLLQCNEHVEMNKFLCSLDALR